MRIYFARNLSDPKSDMWILYPAPNNLEAAIQRARAGFGTYPHANGFRIVSRAGEVLAQEARVAAYPRFF